MGEKSEVDSGETDGRKTEIFFSLMITILENTLQLFPYLHILAISLRKE